ncbi:S-layer homology domain-containing protein [Falsibacillus pallidus]|uniref:S-layer family protein n=1 Tax=Falsibacillus pallidus TaxID=493781 RepID=A0A370GCD4_9BACI|nr:S-layer homology domain-containing protein [Falsibacillus pallidus]RDI41371.1 S-layer family protein [Falsibacillus pallidus]
MKKFFMLLVLALAVISAPFATASAAQKTWDMYIPEDLDYDYWAYDELDDFINAGIIDGQVVTEYDNELDEEFSYVYIKPEDSITRAQFTKILVNALGLKMDGTAKTFSDVKKTDWSFPYIQTASSLGIVNGKLDGTFAPNAKITRDQAAAMIYRAFQNNIQFKSNGIAFKDVTKDNFAYDAINKTSANGIVKGYGELFKPHTFATRAQAMVMIHRALQQESVDKPADSALMDVVSKLNNDEITYLNALDKAKLTDLYNQTTTDYQFAMSQDNVDMVDAYNTEDGSSLKIEIIKPFTLTVLSSSTHFAKVHVNDFQYKVTSTFPDGNFSLNVNGSNTAYLKKTEDGSWKVYNVVMDDEQEETLADEAASISQN